MSALEAAQCLANDREHNQLFGILDQAGQPVKVSEIIEKNLKDENFQKLVDARTELARSLEEVKIVKESSESQPFATNPDNPASPFKTASKLNISVRSTDFEGPEGEERFKQAMKQQCEVLAKGLQIPIESACVEREIKYLEELQKFLAANTEPRDRFVKAAFSEWPKIAAEERKKIEEASHPNNPDSCFYDQETQKNVLITTRTGVQNSLLCFGTEMIISGNSPLIKKGGPFGGTMEFTNEGRTLVYDAPILNPSAPAIFHVHLNPAYFFLLGGTPEEWRRLLEQSPRFQSPYSSVGFR
jgi:hypothetical protein